jgi:peptidoglycan-associated lipoprotein
MRWVAVAAAVVLVFAVGCSKKQTVKSTEPSSEAGATASTAGDKTGAGSEGIATETVKPEAGKAGTESQGTQVARAGEVPGAAGVAVTQEVVSPFKDILFDFDQSLIREDARPVLAAIAEYMKKNPGAKLVVEGHCDERGTAEYNMALGERRAESARTYLVSLGVPAGSLSTVSFGKERPLDPGHNEDAWAKNRRGHFLKK